MQGKDTSDNFVPTSYKCGTGIEAYDEHTAKNLTSDKGVTSREVKYADFVREVLKDKNYKKNYYFGKISTELADDICECTGLELNDYNLVVSSDNIRHSLREHSNALREDRKGQVALNERLLSKMPEVYNNPDDISLSDHTDTRGRNIIIFEKRINGIIIVVSAISGGKKRLALDTMYIKKSHPTMPDADYPQALRPKRSAGKASFENSISDIFQNVNG